MQRSELVRRDIKVLYRAKAEREAEVEVWHNYQPFDGLSTTLLPPSLQTMLVTGLEL